jgi:AcrR family transcriptional regulator
MRPSWKFFRSQFTRLADRDPDGMLDQLALRLEDSEEALSILRARGYTGLTLAEIARHVPPATLRHS